jgi:hypothetical protein
MTSKELEAKLRAEVSDDIRIKEHASLAGISNVFWRQYEVCPCPTFDVRDEYNQSYTYEFPNGMFGIHNAVDSITAKVQATIDYFTSEEGAQLEEDEKKPDAKIFFNQNNEITPLNEGNITI